jgi:polar amino acid transport system substrate-binding protein
MRRVLSGALLVLAGLASAQARAQARAQAPAPLPVAVEDDAGTWSRSDGTGFANDVVRAAFRAAGVEVRFDVVPYARCKDMVVQGRVAACFSMSHARELDGVVRFPSRPLFVCHADLVQHASAPLSARRLRDLPRGTVIGTVRGYEYPPDLREAQAAGIVRVEESPSEAILLRKLAAGRVRGAVINVNDTKPLEYVAARAGLTGDIRTSSRVGDLSSNIGFSVRNARGAWALERFETGMRVITSSGALASIGRRWSDSARIVIGANRARPGSRAP